MNEEHPPWHTAEATVVLQALGTAAQGLDPGWGRRRRAGRTVPPS